MLKWNDPKGLKALTVELVNQNSISGTKNEIEMAKLIHKKLGEVPYFENNPENLFIEPVEKDLLGRYFVSALLEGKRDSKDTLILIGHMDTVDIQDYNSLKTYAFSPYEYTKRLDSKNLSQDAREDLESNKWLFGRGIMDMKAGMAWQMSLIEEYSTLDDFDGNLLFLAVPDEENNSAGMLSAVKFINKLIEKKGLNPLAVLNCEPDFATYPGDNNKYVYLGTAGKIILGFYFVGKECHVGESLSGMNTNLIASEFIRRLEINSDLSDEVDGEVALPPTCLKYKDLKELYSAQTPFTSVAYFNLQTLKMSPKEALGKIKRIAMESMNDAINKVQAQRNKYKEQSNLPVIGEKFDPKVLYYEELYKMAKDAHGEKLDQHIEKCLKEWINDESLDERELNSKLISEVHSFYPTREPMIVMFCAPPYYPHVGLEGKNDFEEKLIELTERLIEKAENDYGEKLIRQKYFQGLSDLSYFALQDAKEVIEYLIPNTPSWGARYELPVEEIKKLNLPVLNYGPHGRDPHKYTERILTDYSFETGPKLLRYLVNEIFSM